MTRRTLLFFGVTFAALTLPLAAAVFNQRATQALSNQDLSTLLTRRGYSELGPAQRRGDVVLLTVTDRNGQRQQLVVTFDGTVVGERLAR